MNFEQRTAIAIGAWEKRKGNGQGRRRVFSCCTTPKLRGQKLSSHLHAGIAALATESTHAERKVGSSKPFAFAYRGTEYSSTVSKENGKTAVGIGLNCYYGDDIFFPSQEPFFLYDLTQGPVLPAWCLNRYKMPRVLTSQTVFLSYRLHSSTPCEPLLLAASRMLGKSKA